ncbi:SURF1 family protein [Demequina zhanjiangensis]|uniref:SURF1-like protein n=1 Tax=Demequina zhanjiangensis TaxID=3051659 RepID=A0ABT8G2C3_9MICO|nr:SURF1 family protein [Demequina sp. SYSU T00b26]MDN4473094.1 SURF1 family protein [Demequina sp. SYSU T00b26]
MSSPDSPGTRALRTAREIGWGRLAITVLIVLVMSALCVVAGRWQYGRYETRAQAMEDYDLAQQEPVAAVEEVASPGSDALPEGAEWRTVTVAGVVDTESVVPLRNRPVDSTAAYQYLAWMHLADGAAVLVNLGWAPVESGTTVDDVVASLPDETLAVSGTLRSFEDDDGRRDSGATRITPAQVRDPDSDVIVAGYVALDAPCGELCDADGPLTEVPLPTLSLGPHLSYAWQWWAFALLVPVGAWLLTKRDLELKRDPAAAPARERQPRAKRRRGPSDEEIEDAL